MSIEIKKIPGSTKNRKRIGRGTGNGTGKTCGKGNKGQKSRSGGGVARWFEGGQMPIYRRLPKKGFTNHFRVENNIINVSMLNVFNEGDEITVETLKEKSMIKNNNDPVKILGKGDLEKKNLKIKVNKVSESARKKIEAAGGSVELV